MIGEGQGTELIARTKNSRKRGDDSQHSDIRSMESDESLNSESDPEKTEGMIPRMLADVFREIQKAPPSVEFTIRCSFVEIYLERVYDLLQPGLDGIRVDMDNDGDAAIIGASELCCTDINDVYAILARGNAYRTHSATIQNADSSRSHAIFTLRIDQVDRDTGKYRSSRLQMLDMAGSELARQKSSRQLDSAVGMEGKMVNQSLVCLANMIRARVAEQGGTERSRVSSTVFANSSKLAKLLLPSFGGNAFTVLICTASPSSYNIGETINTIKFAQRVQKLKNSPRVQESYTVDDYKKRLTKSERRLDSLMQLVKSLTNECLSLKDPADGKRGNPKIWEVIKRISEEGGSEQDVEFSVQVLKKGENPAHEPDEPTQNTAELEKQLQEEKLAREKSENTIRDLQSEVASLRSQTEILTSEKLKSERELADAKAEIRALATRKVEVEHNLRTSQFRENEATAFLRQFRSFYLRLLKSKAAQGNGDANVITAEISRRIPGVPELTDLIDIDTLMVASGLLEKHEIGQDTNNSEYLPSKDALSRSAAEAEQTEQKELKLARAAAEKHDGNVESSTQEGGHDFLSIVNRQNSVQLISYRSRLLETPAGRLAIEKERELEAELTELTKRCISLQNSANAEKAMVEALSARQGALSKMKQATDMNTLRQELERKTNDLQAIVWKMNELHLVNKTLDEKVESREQHVTYLEEHVVDLQTRNRRLVIDRQEAEKKLREESATLKWQLDGLSNRLWQLGESSSDASQPWRIIVPFKCGENAEQKSTAKQERRMSIGELVDEIACTVSSNAADSEKPAEPPKPALTEVATQTEDTTKEDAVVQTDIAAVGDSCEASTQTNSDDKNDIAIQTEEDFPETKEMNEISIQTDESGKINSFSSETSTQTDEVKFKNDVDSTDTSTQTDSEVLLDASVQTDLEKVEGESMCDAAIQTEEDDTKQDQKSEASVQTESVEFAKPAAPVLDTATQTDDLGQERSSKVDASDVSTQTDAERVKLFLEASTQTDELPRVIAVDGNRSVDSNSLEEADLKGDEAETHTRGAMDSQKDDHLAHSHSTSGSERWKVPNRTPSFDKNKVDDDSLAAGSNSSIGSLKDKLQKMGVSPNPEDRLGASMKLGQSTPIPIEERLGASMYDKFNSSGSISPVVTLKSAGNQDWRAKLRAKGEGGSTPMTPTGIKAALMGKGPGPPRPPLTHSGASTASYLTEGKRRHKSDDQNIPEWMSKFRQMGIKADDDDDADTKAAFRHSFGSKSGGRDPTSELMEKLKKMNQKIEESELPESAKLKDQPTPIVEQGPEWMQKFKEIGMKGEEKVIEASRESLANQAASVPTESKEPPMPEWMLKYKQIGLKSVDEIVSGERDILQGGKPADFEPRRFLDKVGKTITPGVTHESGDAVDEEYERLRKEEKKARKKEKKEKKKEKERKGSN